MTGKKIGVFTLHWAVNYGTVMQCYALNKAISDMGYDVENLNYNPWGGGYSTKYFLKKRPSKSIPLIRTWKAMNAFYKKNVKMTEPIIGVQAMKDNPPIKDTYVVGSDIVWNRMVVEDYLDQFLLSFAPEGSRCISYAASTGGLQEIDPIDKDVFKENLKRFSAVSVREKQSLSSIQELCDVPVVDVCDPTFLLSKEQWISLEKKVRVPKNYIAVYDLNSSPMVKKMAYQLKQKTGCTLVNVCANRQKWLDKNFWGLSPQEWLYVMHHADYIIPQSFHGLAFSLIFEKPFLCTAVLDKDGNEHKKNGRQTNLLSIVGLEKQFFSTSDFADEDLNVDFSEARIKIDEYRKRSINWLKESL